MKPPRLPSVMRPSGAPKAPGVVGATGPTFDGGLAKVTKAKPYVGALQGGIPAKPGDSALPAQGDARMANGGKVTGRTYAKCG